MNRAILNKIIHATCGIHDTDFNNAMTHFINNISDVDLNAIPGFQPCGKKLYITRPKMREEIRLNLKLRLPQFFKERGYSDFDEINGCTHMAFETTLELAIKILVSKQQAIR